MNDDLYNAILDELAACHHDDDLSITYLPEREQIAERIMKRIEPMIDAAWPVKTMKEGTPALRMGVKND